MPRHPIAGSPGCRQFPFEAGAGRPRVWGTTFLSQGGVTVNLVGGDLPHIGAVAISIPRPSLARPSRRSATTSVFTLVGHKEDELARPFADGLARALGVTAVVVAGVHIRQARSADLARVFENAGRAMEMIIRSVRGETGLSRRASDGAGGRARARGPKTPPNGKPS